MGELHGWPGLPPLLVRADWLPVTDVDWLDALRERHLALLGAWRRAVDEVAATRARFAAEDTARREALMEQHRARARDGAAAMVVDAPKVTPAEHREAEIGVVLELAREARAKALAFVEATLQELWGRSDELLALAGEPPTGGQPGSREPWTGADDRRWHKLRNLVRLLDAARATAAEEIERVRRLPVAAQEGGL